MNEPNHITPEAEPTTTSATVPMWLIVGTLVLFFLGAWFFEARGGWFEQKVYAPYASMADLEKFQPFKGNEPDFARGRRLFEQNCGSCHGSDGAGKPNQAPSFVGSEWVLTKGVNRLVRIPQVGLTGPIDVKGEVLNFPAPMGPMGAPYKDEELADVLSYIRTAWGNKAKWKAPEESWVTAEQVKKVRAALAGRTQAYTPEELKKEAE